MPLRLGGLIDQPQHVSLPPLGDAYWTSDYSAFVPRSMTTELAEFIGYFMGDGSLHSKGIRLCVTQADQDVVERLVTLGQSLFGLKAAISQQQGYQEVAFHSVRLVLWWEACNFAKFAPRENHSGKGYLPHIPDAVLHSNDRAIYAAFIRGLFEADGTFTGQYISFTTSSIDFCHSVQTLLLSLGFTTTRKSDRPIGRWSTNLNHMLRLLNVASTTRFLHEIGFLSERKRTVPQPQNHPQVARYDHIPLSRELVDRLAPTNDNLRKALLLTLSRHGTASRHAVQALYERSQDPELQHLLSFFYDKVSKVETAEPQPTYAITGVEGMCYLANGFTCLGS